MLLMNVGFISSSRVENILATHEINIFFSIHERNKSHI